MMMLLWPLLLLPLWIYWFVFFFLHSVVVVHIYFRCWCVCVDCLWLRPFRWFVWSISLFYTIFLIDDLILSKQFMSSASKTGQYLFVYFRYSIRFWYTHTRTLSGSFAAQFQFGSGFAEANASPTSFASKNEQYTRILWMQTRNNSQNAQISICI